MGHEHIHTYIQANRNKKNTRITTHQENTLHINNILKSTGLIAKATSNTKEISTYTNLPLQPSRQMGCPRHFNLLRTTSNNYLLPIPVIQFK